MPQSQEFIDQRRKEVKAFASDTTVKMREMTSHPNKQITEKINKAMEKALRKIAELDPTCSLPVIVGILEDIIKITNNRPSLQQTNHFVDASRKILTDIDEKQNHSLLQVKKDLEGITKEQIESDLKKLIPESNDIQVTNELIPLYKELEMWLEGLYLHTCLSNSIRNFLEDKTFHELKGLKKIDVAIYYHKAAMVISDEVSKYLAQTEKASIATDITPMPEKKPAIETLDVQHVEPDELFQLKKLSDGRNKLITRIPPEHEDKIPLITEFIEETLGLKPKKSSLIEWLQSAKTDKDKISKLHAIKSYTLTDAQKTALADLKQTIVGDYMAYINDRWLFNNINADIARATIKLIEDINDTKKLIEILFDKRAELIGRHSDRLLPITDTILLNVYKLLLESVTLEQRTAPSLTKKAVNENA